MASDSSVRSCHLYPIRLRKYAQLQNVTNFSKHTIAQSLWECWCLAMFRLGAMIGSLIFDLHGEEIYFVRSCRYPANLLCHHPADGQKRAQDHPQFARTQPHLTLTLSILRIIELKILQCYGRYIWSPAMTVLSSGLVHNTNILHTRSTES